MAYSGLTCLAEPVAGPSCAAISLSRDEPDALTDLPMHGELEAWDGGDKTESHC